MVAYRPPVAFPGGDDERSAGEPPIAPRPVAAPPAGWPDVRTVFVLMLGLVLLITPASEALREQPTGRLKALTSAGFGPAPAESPNQVSGVGTGDLRAPAGSPAQRDQRRPDPTAPPQAYSAWLRGQLSRMLERQAGALRAGDREGFLAPAAAGDAQLRAELDRRFTALHALKVSRWEEAPSGEPTAAGGGSWNVPVRLRYCFVVPDCVLVPLTVQTRWRDSGTSLTLTSFGTSPATETGPRPWEVSELKVAIGDRVVLATTAKYASRLPGMLVAAEKAAAVADRFARWDPPPGRYVVYLAGSQEWGTWYGVRQANWAAGYAMPLTNRHSEIVLNASRVNADDAGDVLRHEFAHVVTLSGVRQDQPGTWWLVEGIAEYIQTGPKPLNSYDGLGEARRYVNSGRWNGDITLGEPERAASTSEANGRYGVAYLAVRRIAERFGEEKLLEFFAGTVRAGGSLEQVSQSVLGTPWPEVAADATAHVRRTIG